MENTMNYSKYTPYPASKINERSWPDKRITKAPRWCSVDLRDGNQSLSSPMTLKQKTNMFKMLLEMGFKEIEIGFPASSETEFRFVRKLLNEKMIPGDVVIQVLTQARPALIERTFKALAGSNRVIINICNPTSPVQREFVLQKSKEETIKNAVESVMLIKALSASSKINLVGLEYCPESFMSTEQDFALDICNAVIDAWQPQVNNKMIINLAATVEMCTPNIFADSIELFCRNVHNRESLDISVHAHNDRGTAVAATELALMAGAERVEGTLFGNGERCGNTDIITMALNMLGQGIDPCLNITDIGNIKNTYNINTGMEVHPRHPYAGELAFTTFSGSHQDAISKVLKKCEQSKQNKWNIPYLAIDPKDIGRSYGSIIRINSQSGKGGAAYIMEKEFGISLPCWFQADFGKAVKSLADQWGKELLPANVVDCFVKEYLGNVFPYRLKTFCTQAKDAEKNSKINITAGVVLAEKSIIFTESGGTPLEAFVKGLIKNTGLKITVARHEENSIVRFGEVMSAAYIEIKDEKDCVSFGS
jgi:2-isopropylmalate synthase